TLSRYFREMANHRVLTPREEIEAAKEVERLEIGYWEALLAYPPVLETGAKVLERHIQEPLADLATLRKLARTSQHGRLVKRSEQKWNAIALALGTKLRELDADRLFVQQAYRAVHRLAGQYADERDIVGGEVRVTPAFKKTLRGIEGARDAQQLSKNRFVAANLRLVVSIARRYNRGRLPLIDLIQEGNIGLMKECARFDPPRG